MLFEKTAKDTKKKHFSLLKKSPICKKKCRRHGIPVTPPANMGKKVGTAIPCGSD